VGFTDHNDHEELQQVQSIHISGILNILRVDKNQHSMGMSCANVALSCSLGTC